MNKTIYCTNCGNMMEENVKIAPIDNICSKCGVSDKQYSSDKKPKKWKYCRNCGNKLDKMAEKCPKCRNVVGPLESGVVIMPYLAHTYSNDDIDRMNEGR